MCVLFALYGIGRIFKSYWHTLRTLLHIIDMRRVIAVKITNTYVTKNKIERLEKQTELHCRCILLLQAAKHKERDAA